MNRLKFVSLLHASSSRKSLPHNSTEVFVIVLSASKTTNGSPAVMTRGEIFLVKTGGNSTTVNSQEVSASPTTAEYSPSR